MKIMTIKWNGIVFEEAWKIVNKTNYNSNKWLDVADDVAIAIDMVYKHQAVELCHKENDFDLTNCKPLIRATHWKTNKVKFYDMKYNFECADENDQNYIPATSNIILLVTKCFWYNKLRLEIDNDIENANNKRNIDIPKLTDELTQIEKQLRWKWIENEICWGIGNSEKEWTIRMSKRKEQLWTQKISFVVFLVVKKNYFEQRWLG